MHRLLHPDENEFFQYVRPAVGCIGPKTVWVWIVTKVQKARREREVTREKRDDCRAIAAMSEDKEEKRETRKRNAKGREKL